MVDIDKARLQRSEVLKKFYEQSQADSTYPVESQLIKTELELDFNELSKAMEYLREKGFIYYKENPFATAKITSRGIDEFEREKNHPEQFSLKSKEEDVWLPGEEKGEEFGYVSAIRIKELKALTSERVDLAKLIRLCEELNTAYANKLNLAIAMLLRAILDHVPPIFSKDSFKEVASGHGGKSFKETMKHLQDGARKIADSHLHVQIRKKEVLPTYVQVNFSQYLDVLLAEIIAILQAETA